MSALLKACNGGDPGIDLTQGLVAHYLFNGNVDDSYGTYDGSNSGADFQDDAVITDGVSTYCSTLIDDTLFNAMSFFTSSDYYSTFGNGNTTRRFYISVYVHATTRNPWVLIRWRDGTTFGYYSYLSYTLTTMTIQEGESFHVYIERQRGTKYDKVYFNSQLYNVNGSQSWNKNTTKTFYNHIDIGYRTENTSNTFTNSKISSLRFYSDSKDQEFIDAIYNTEKGDFI